MIPVSQPKIGEAEQATVLRALKDNRVSMGPWVQRFEDTLAEFFGVDYALTASSGTTALHLALLALGVKPGDEVLVPNLTFVATANAVRYCGATPIPVEVHEQTWTIDPDYLPHAWNPGRTVGIIPVHLYGVPADMDHIVDFARERRLWILEDAAEAFGGALYGDKLGTIGDIGTFSFYGNKTLTTGEGGAIVTRDPQLAARVRKLRGQAQVKPGEYWHDEVGFNYRMTDLSGALGVAQMSHARELISERTAIVGRYRSNLDHRYRHQYPDHRADVAWWMEALCVHNRDHVRAELKSQGIETRPGFVPMSQLPMYASGRHLPVSSALAQTVLCLPTYAGLTFEEVDRICDVFVSVAR